MSNNPTRNGSHFSPEPSSRGSRPVRGGDTRRSRGSSTPDRRAGYAGGVSQRSVSATRRAAGNAGSHARGERPGGPRRRWPKVAFMLLVVCGLLVGAGTLAWRHFSSSGKAGGSVAAGQRVTVTIPEGSGGSQIAQILLDAGVIGDSGEFFKAVQAQGAESSMKSGSYDFLTGANVSEVVRQLVSGPNSAAGKLTIAEGLTLQKTAEAVGSSGIGVSAEDFLNQAEASNYVADYPFLARAANDSLEGFLFPKTYDFGGTPATADSVIRAMLDQYGQEVASLDLASAEARIKETYGIDMSDYGILTLASIIEKEALNDEDRSNISSVMYNRMREGMALQSDATMGYVTGGAVSADDLKTQSPYNTYLNAGLTPTPICSPSLASIKAAMDPPSTNYLYFWITQSEHVFSETYDQHLQAISNAS
ncbi:hypothetical protein HMPREF1008_01276 [Olsenella sp. oral taxon 809 str. F0356]|uniref:endolytic transglycosylase MltG n=1 Tax=Olsenella sp. oral taxon 809 TaxID=661086 RepID=UPI000231ED91|nr:endolytic transglycosylase MltG [Olsenella sp. oral taxon 809]EHF01652.1 hypothetical protein HMPREF1008_01276 [Olsenella sp. oral taxon 809 str. F0356]